MSGKQNKQTQYRNVEYVSATYGRHGWYPSSWMRAYGILALSWVWTNTSTGSAKREAEWMHPTFGAAQLYHTVDWVLSKDRMFGYGITQDCVWKAHLDLLV
jgi:hypothetical protein